MCNLEYYFLNCKCTCLEHLLRFTFDPDSGDVWVDVMLAPLVWWKRLWVGIKYILNIDTRSLPVHYEETILKTRDYDTIRLILEKSEIAKEKLPEAPEIACVKTFE